jgi:hypothetical protein
MSLSFAGAEVRTYREMQPTVGQFVAKPPSYRQATIDSPL